MINKLHNLLRFIEKVKSSNFINKILLFLILPFSMNAQTITWIKKPIDMQLFARNETDKGEVIFEGIIDNTVIYESIEIFIYRNGIPYDSGSVTKSIVYSGGVAPFNFNFEIDAELAEYSFEMYGKTSTQSDLLYSVDDVVAGDVYIIQGQSNAEAKMQVGSTTANGNQSEFIRVYASGLDNDGIFEPQNNHWNIGEGDGPNWQPGNTGQWGLKLAKLIIDNNSIPVAVFNGAKGGKPISYFQKDAVRDHPLSNNYERLYYRLLTSGLKEAVKAVFWSQGEDNIAIGTSTQDYIDLFNSLKASWLSDYPNIKKIYIFQTKSGCDEIGLSKGINIKEAQRLLAVNDKDIHIMQTAGLTYVEGSYNCHFTFTGGYEDFANRIYKLIDRDFYGGIYGIDIEPPMITVPAYLTDDTTLIVETNAISLSTNGSVLGFTLNNSNGVSINEVNVKRNKIIFTLNKKPKSTTTISYEGLGAGENQIVQNNFIVNSKFLELVCFNELEIDIDRYTIWENNNWSNSAPDETKYTIINDEYSDTTGSLVTKNLTINSGFTLNFDGKTSPSNNSIIVYGNITVKDNANLIVGDTESLVIANDNPDAVSGIITKIEKSNVYTTFWDNTYWSSPVQNACIDNVFTGVDPDRIFQFNQSNSDLISPNDPTDPFDPYYDVWEIALDTMETAVGYAVQGPDDMPDGTRHIINFVGAPNNGVLSKSIYYNPDDGNNEEPENDYNLVGNPYPTAIDIEKFLFNNLSVNEVQLWQQGEMVDEQFYAQADYVVYNQGGSNNPDVALNIGSAQGFMVRALSAGSVTFSAAMKIPDQNDQFFKSETTKKDTVDNKVTKDRIWLNMHNENKIANNILIGFFKESTDGLDPYYDSFSLNKYKDLNFYSVLDQRDLVVQGLGTFNEDKIVALGFDTKKVGNLTIGISKTEGALSAANIYLVDNLLGITHDLKSGDYQFEQTDTGEFLERFTLQFATTALGIDDFTLENDFNITNTYEGFSIHSNKTVAKIKVYDMLGRLLVQKTPNKQCFNLKLINIKKGTVLIFESILDNGSVLNKKAIKF